MNPATLPFLSLPLLFCLFPFMNLQGQGAKESPGEVILIEEGKPRATLYLPATPSPGAIEGALELAVKELDEHLQKMSGTSLEKIRTDDPAQVRPPALVLGSLAIRLGAQPQRATESREGFRLLQEKGNVLIGGESDDGTLFGVYALLRHLGCDWVMPGEIGEVIPRRPSVAVTLGDHSEAPGFPIRSQYYGGNRRANGEEEIERFEQWMRRHGKGAYEHPAMQTRGHYWPHFIQKHQSAFEADPTMYALVALPDGSFTRRGPQLESTHPEVIRLMAADIREAFASKGWPKDKAVGFPLGPADGSAFSQSAESRAANSGGIDAISGREEMTDLMVLLCNQVLEALGEEYPNVYVGYYVYAQYSGFPRRYKPHPRVVPIFASINYSRHYSSVDPRSRTRAAFRESVRQWGELSREQGNFLVSRDFNYNLADGLSPVTKLAVWGEEIPFYHRQGVRAFTINAARSWATLGPQIYLLQRLMWNPQLPWKEVLAEYCRNAFGKAAPEMETYFERLIRAQKEAGQEAGSYLALHLIFSPEWTRETRRLLDRALALAQAPEEKTRIGYLSDGFRSLEEYLAWFEATVAFDFPRAAAAYDAMMEHQQAMIARHPALTTPSAQRYLERFLKPFVDASLRYSSGEYQLIEALPDELPTLFDPHLVGESMEYFQPAIADKGWLRTKTYSSTWDAQGLGNLRGGARGGAVWYRWRFEAPERKENGPSLGLFLGAFDDEARVWLNGKAIGSSGRSFSKPAVYDLSGAARKGENTLVVEVVRNSPLNELGSGGLFRPSFLFTGPKLPKAAEVPPEDHAQQSREQHLEMLREGEQAY